MMDPSDRLEEAMIAQAVEDAEQRLDGLNAIREGIAEGMSEGAIRERYCWAVGIGDDPYVTGVFDGVTLAEGFFKKRVEDIKESPSSDAVWFLHNRPLGSDVEFLRASFTAFSEREANALSSGNNHLARSGKTKDPSEWVARRWVPAAQGENGA